MYNDRNSQAVTIQVSAIDGIQMPQSPMPAQAMPQAAPQMPQEDTGAEAGQDASPQAKTAFVAALEAVRQYHMAKDPAEKAQWKQAADNLHQIVTQDGPQMMSCKVEYTALMAAGGLGDNNPASGMSGQTPGRPKTKVKVPPVKPVTPADAKPQTPQVPDVKPQGAPKPTPAPQAPGTPNVQAPVAPVVGEKSKPGKIINPNPNLGGWPDADETPEMQQPGQNNIPLEQASEQQGTNAGQLKVPASEGVEAGNMGFGGSASSPEAQAQHDQNVTMTLAGLYKAKKVDGKVFANLINESKKKPLSQQGITRVAEVIEVPPGNAINLAREFKKRAGMQGPKKPSEPPMPDRVSQQAKTVTQSPQDIKDMEEVRKAEAEGRKHQFELTVEEKALGNASHPDVAESQSKRFQKAYQALESEKNAPKTESPPTPEQQVAPAQSETPQGGKVIEGEAVLPEEPTTPAKANSTVEVDPAKGAPKPTAPKSASDEALDPVNKAFEEGTKPKGIDTAQTALNVLHHLVGSARSFVGGRYGEGVGGLANAAATREGFRSDQKVFQARQEEAKGETDRWGRIVKKMNGEMVGPDGKSEGLTTTEAVAARRAFKRYDLKVKKAIAAALNIPNAKNLTSDELNVEVDNFFNKNSPDSQDAAERHDQMLQQNQKFVDTMDAGGTLTPAEVRGFKNDLHALTHPELKSLAESQGLNPMGSRKLLINQLKSKIDSHEEGRVAREKAKAGSKELLDEQVDALKLAYDPQTGEYVPEAPITDKAVATGMSNTFSKLTDEEKIATLKKMVENPDEIDQIKGTGLNTRFREELDKHTLKSKTRGQELQGEDNLDVADKIKNKLEDPEAEGLSQEDLKSFVQSLPKDEQELRTLGVAMGINDKDANGKDIPIQRLRVRIRDMAASALQKEADPLENGENEDSGDIDALAEHLASDEDNVLTKTNAAIMKKAIPKGDTEALREMSEKMNLNTVNPLNGKPYGPLALEENIKEEIVKRTEKPERATKAPKAPPKDEGDEGGGPTPPPEPPTTPPAPPAAPAGEAKAVVPENELPFGAPQAAPEIPKPASGPSAKPLENKGEPIAKPAAEKPKATRPSRAKPEDPKVDKKALGEDLIKKAQGITDDQARGVMKQAGVKKSDIEKLNEANRAKAVEPEEPATPPDFSEEEWMGRQAPGGDLAQKPGESEQDHEKRVMAARDEKRAEAKSNRVPKEGELPEEQRYVPKEVEKGQRGQITTIRNIAEDMSETGDFSGFIRADKAPDIVKAYFDKVMPPGPDKKVRDARYAAWARVIDKTAAISAVFSRGAQPEDIEEFLDDITDNMRKGKEDVLEGTLAAIGMANRQKAVDESAKPENRQTGKSLASEEVRATKAFKDVDPIDHEFLGSRDQINKKIQELTSMASTIERLSKNGEDDEQPMPEELADLPNLQRRAKALMALHRELGEKKSPPQDGGDQGGGSAPSKTPPKKPSPPSPAKTESEIASQNFKDKNATTPAPKPKVTPQVSWDDVKPGSELSEAEVKEKMDGMRNHPAVVHRYEDKESGTEVFVTKGKGKLAGQYGVNLVDVGTGESAGPITFYPTIERANAAAMKAANQKEPAPKPKPATPAKKGKDKPSRFNEGEESEKVNQGMARIAAARKQVEEEGHDPKELDSVAKEVRDQHNAEADKLNLMLREAKEAIKGAQDHRSAFSGKAPAKGTRFDAIANKGGDWTKTVGFDMATEEMAERHPELFKPENGENGSREDQLFEMLKTGAKAKMTVAEAMEEAAKRIINRGPSGDGGEAAPTGEEVAASLSRDDDEAWKDVPSEGGDLSFDVGEFEGSEEQEPFDSQAVANKLKTGGAVTPDEAKGARAAYAKMSGADKIAFAKALGLSKAGSALDSTRDDLVEREIANGEFRKSREDKGIDPELQEGGTLFKEPGIGESAGLFDEVGEEDSKPAEVEKPTETDESKKVSEGLKTRAARRNIEDAANEFLDDPKNIGVPGVRYDLLYDAAKKKMPDLTEDQFRSVMEDMRDDRGNWTMGGWAKTKHEIHNPKLAIPREKGNENPGSNVQYYVQRPASRQYDAPKPQAAPEPETKPAPVVKKKEPEVASKPEDGVPDSLITEIQAVRANNRKSQNLGKKEATALAAKLEKFTEEQLKESLGYYQMAPVNSHKLTKAQIIAALVKSWRGGEDD